MNQDLQKTLWAAADMLRANVDSAEYQKRSIETALVMEELCVIAKKFKAAADRGETLGLNEDELAFYNALVTNEASVKELVSCWPRSLTNLLKICART